MVRLLGAIGAALIVLAPLAFGQSSCGNTELLGGRGGACVLSVTKTETGPVRVYRPAPLAEEETRPIVYSGISERGTAQSVGQAGVTVIRGAAAAPVEPKSVAVEKPFCRYLVRRLSDRRDGARRYDVCIDDFGGLKTEDGLEVVYDRLVRTADAACEKDDRQPLARQKRICMQILLDEAIRNSGLEDLALYHARRRSRLYSDRLAIVGPEAN